MKKMKGFTLIEMIITITVIIVLSAISVPIYKSYTEDAILAEGYVLLSAIREAQRNYYSEWGNFLSAYQSSGGNTAWTNNEEVLGIDARGNKYFTWFRYGIINTSSHYYFFSRVSKPAEVRKTDDFELMLQYNISLGQRIINYPKDYDSSWE